MPASATCCRGTKPPPGSGPAAAERPRGRKPMASSSSRRLSSWTGSPISFRRRGNIAIATTGYLRRITSSGLPSRHSRKGNVGKRRDAAAGGHAGNTHAADGCCDANHATLKPRSHDTSRIAWAKLIPRVGEFPLECRELRRRHPAEGGRPAGAGLLRTGGSQAGEGQDGFARVKSAPDTPRRTTRAASRLSRSWPARRLGRARADP